MIDFHTHIIPQIDDGAKNAKMAIEMLDMLSSQGVDTVCLSPHFYAGSVSADNFLAQREEKVKILLDEAKLQGKKLPKLVLGAEILFFRTIYSYDDIRKLCIDGTDYILLEMPFEKWTDSMLDVIYKLISNCGVKPIIAHIDRYLQYGNDALELMRLKSRGALIQANCDAFSVFSIRRKIFSYMKKGIVDVLGSDCHSMGVRRPNFDVAISQIEKKFGKEAIEKIEKSSEKIIKNAIVI